MILGIEQPPEFLGKILRIVANALEVVEVFGRYFLQGLSHPAHADRGQPVAYAARVQLFTEIFHEFSALRLTGILHGALDVDADVLHGGIVHFRL